MHNSKKHVPLLLLKTVEYSRKILPIWVCLIKFLWHFFPHFPMVGNIGLKSWQYSLCFILFVFMKLKRFWFTQIESSLLTRFKHWVLIIKPEHWHIFLLSSTNYLWFWLLFDIKQKINLLTFLLIKPLNIKIQV